MYLHFNSTLGFSKRLNRRLAGERSKAVFYFHVILIRASEMVMQMEKTERHTAASIVHVRAHRLHQKVSVFFFSLYQI